MNSIGQNLVILLKKKGMKQCELAERLGVSDAALSRWITGTRILHAKYRKKICEILGVDDYELHAIKKILSEEKNWGPIFDNLRE